TQGRAAEPGSAWATSPPSGSATIALTRSCASTPSSSATCNWRPESAAGSWPAGAGWPSRHGSRAGPSPRGARTGPPDESGLVTALTEQGVTMSYKGISQTVAEGDFGYTRSEGQFAGQPFIFHDLFRVINGKCAEHWDVMVPAQA